jgi:hypothetical protein
LVDNPICWRTRFPFYDHERWSERRHAKPGNGARERAYSIQRRSSRHRRHISPYTIRKSTWNRVRRWPQCLRLRTLPSRLSI